MYNHLKKELNVKALNDYMLVKTSSMFEWQGLPESMPYREIEKQLQTVGYTFIYEVDGTLYALNGSLGGVGDVYGNPTQIVIANPALKLNKTVNLTDGVLITNDDYMLGLLPLFDKHNTLLVENEINMIVSGYNTRMNTIITAPDDKTKASAEAYVGKVINGEVAIIGENTMFDGIRTHNSNSTVSAITGMIEYHQYIKASLQNEIGLSANFNMKRERLTADEVTVGEDSLFPLVLNMLKCRMKAVEKLNEKFNLELDVDFGSVWAVKKRDLVDDIIESNMPEELATDLEPTVEPSVEPTHPPKIDSSLVTALESLTIETVQEKLGDTESGADVEIVSVDVDLKQNDDDIEAIKLILEIDGVITAEDEEVLRQLANELKGVKNAT